jgi:hypothetical protein
MSNIPENYLAPIPSLQELDPTHTNKLQQSVVILFPSDQTNQTQPTQKLSNAEVSLMELDNAISILSISQQKEVAYVRERIAFFIIKYPETAKLALLAMAFEVSIDEGQ